LYCRYPPLVEAADLDTPESPSRRQRPGFDAAGVGQHQALVNEKPRLPGDSPEPNAFLRLRQTMFEKTSRAKSLSAPAAHTVRGTPLNQEFFCACGTPCLRKTLEPTTFTRLRQTLFEEHPKPTTFLRLRHNMFEETPTQKLFRACGRPCSGKNGMNMRCVSLSCHTPNHTVRR
jgi:hypothetical protein